jgi:hypothetical protein
VNVLYFVAVLAELLDDQVDVYHAGLDAGVSRSDFPVSVINQRLLPGREELLLCPER